MTFVHALPTVPAVSSPAGPFTVSYDEPWTAANPSTRIRPSNNSFLTSWPLECDLAHIQLLFCMLVAIHAAAALKTRHQAMRRVATRALLALAIVVNVLHAQDGVRYREWKKVVDRNTGSAHFTRGMNMYTLMALRSCVSSDNLPVLNQLLDDKDAVTRMSVAHELADFAAERQSLIRAKLEAVHDPKKRSELEDALSSSTQPGYKPILSIR